MLESMSCASELRRLEDGLGSAEQIPGIGTVTFILRCDGNAQEVLHDIVSVLKIVCSECERGWSEETDWRSILPKHFVATCADEMTPTEAEEWLQRWHALSEEERDAEDRDRKWSLANWLYWMNPPKGCGNGGTLALLTLHILSFVLRSVVGHLVVVQLLGCFEGRGHVRLP